jgi:hypothetical protein
MPEAKTQPSSPPQNTNKEAAPWGGGLHHAS